MRTIALFLISLIVASIAYAEICSTTGPITIPECPTITPTPTPEPTPTPIPPGVTQLTVDLGTNSKLEKFLPGDVKYYYFTIPSDATFNNITVGASSQNQHGVVHVLLAKNSLTDITTWFSVALNNYYAGYTYWGSNYFASYSGVPVWAKMAQSTVGQNVVLVKSTSDWKGYVKDIPGTYYVMMKNVHPTDTAYMYVFVNGGY